MLEYLVVAAIVGASGWYTVRKYVFKPKQGGGCGSGCSSCDTCETASVPTTRRVIKLHPVR